jgi:hypothetical protein
MKGSKKYRHNQNPKEKELHDKFINFCKFNSDTIHQVAGDTKENGTPIKYLSKEEQTMIVNTIQWLGSPVGQGFLKECGFSLDEGA